MDDVIEDRSARVSSASSSSSSAAPHVKRYTRGRYLGKGGFAKVYAFTSLDSGREYACKVIPKSSLVKESSRKKLMNEINIHRTIRHASVVRFERFFEDRNNVYILLELCAHQTMLELVKRRGALSEVECQYYVLQLLLTVQHLHAGSIIHRDLKLGNLFLGDALELKVGDFGLATRLEHVDERKRTICGTPNYIAPEILDNSNGHSFEVDVWAIGVIMYTLLYGAPPFETASVKTTYRRIRDNHYRFPQPSEPNYRAVTPAAKALIRRILATDPKARPTLSEMRADAFFTQSGVPDRLGLEVLDAQFPRKHECWQQLQLEELRDREDERRAKEQQAQQQQAQQQQTAVDDGVDQENAATEAPSKADASAKVEAVESGRAQPQPQPQPQAQPQPTPEGTEAAPPSCASPVAARVVLGEKSLNGVKDGASEQQTPATAIAERRPPTATKTLQTLTTAAVSPAGAAAARQSSPQPKALSRRETLEKEREDIIHRLKARTAASTTQTPGGAPPPATPNTAASASAPASVRSAAVSRTKEGPAATVPPSPYRRTLTGVPTPALSMSPSIRRSLSAMPSLAVAPAQPSPTSAASPSSSSPCGAVPVLRAVPALRPPAAVTTPARAKSVSPVPSPFALNTPRPGRLTPSSLPSATTAGSPAVAAFPSPCPPLADTPLTWSSSPSQLVSIASTEAPAPSPTPIPAPPSLSQGSEAACEDAALSLSALPCESPPPLGAEREVDALRKGREERAMRAALEDRILEERKRIRAAEKDSAMARVTRGMAARRREKEQGKAKEKDEEESKTAHTSDEERQPTKEAAVVAAPLAVHAPPSSVPSLALSSSSPSSTSSGRRGGGSPPPPPLPSVIEESFICAGSAEGAGPSCTPPLYVDKWVDYSAKYGLGYLLSDGRVGVYFNDASKAILHSAASTAFTYVERRSREDGGGERVEAFDTLSAPAHLHKKVTLLRHFAKYLTQRSTAPADGRRSSPQPPPPSSSSSFPSSACGSYVRKWLRTKHAIFFRLSCGAVQVIFNDRTELVVGDGRLAYTDRGGRRIGGALDEVESRKDEGLAKRLRYMREILDHMGSKAAAATRAARADGCEDEGAAPAGDAAERRTQGRSRRA